MQVINQQLHGKFNTGNGGSRFNFSSGHVCDNENSGSGNDSPR